MSDAATDLVQHSLTDEVLILTPQVDQMRDTDVCYAIRDEMTQVIEAVEHRKVVIDMQKVDFVSSTGILAFLNLRHVVDEAKGRIVLCNLSESLLGMFRLCKLISDEPQHPTPFAHVDTLEMALADV